MAATRLRPPTQLTPRMPVCVAGASLFSGFPTCVNCGAAREYPNARQASCMSRVLSYRNDDCTLITAARADRRPIRNHVCCQSLATRQWRHGILCPFALRRRGCRACRSPGGPMLRLRNPGLPPGQSPSWDRVGPVPIDRGRSRPAVGSEPNIISFGEGVLG